MGHLSQKITTDTRYLRGKHMGYEIHLFSE